MSKLETLQLSSNKLGGSTPESLGKLSKLKKLELSGNQLKLNDSITDCAVQTQIPETECLALVDLYTSTNGANWENNYGWNATYVPCSWNDPFGGVSCSDGHVTKLTLRDNKLSGSIPESLGNLSNLTDIILNNNQLSGSIPESLGNLSNLKTLELSENQLSGSIPKSLGNLSKLGILELYNNKLSGSITESLNKLSSLSILNLSGNQLKLNDSITDCAVQTQIDKEECHVLVDLYTSTNGANWKENSGWNVTNIPCSWEGVTCYGGNVTGLYLDDNQLGGSIPESLGKLSQLIELSLSDNQLSGSIPESLGKLNKLWIVFNLSSNQLGGSIPESLGKLSKLMEFNLSGNQLGGSIPESLGKLSQLKKLNLSGNQLSGSIPESLGNIDYLMKLDLSNNQLGGSIPESLGKLSNLKQLDLSGNKFAYKYSTATLISIVTGSVIAIGLAFLFFL